METICEYRNSKNDKIRVLWDERDEEVLIIDTKNHFYHTITEIKNMDLDMFIFIANDFQHFDYINEEYFKITDENLVYMSDKCKDYWLFLGELLVANVEIEKVF